MQRRSESGGAIVEFLVIGVVFLLGLFVVVQLAFLFSGKGAVDTASHFAARRFALSARIDLKRAKSAALSEASEMCRHRIGGGQSSLAMTTVDFSPVGAGTPGSARTGEAYRVSLSHWIELVVPWANRVLFALAPVQKVRLGERYFFIFSSSRLVTIE